MPKPIRPQEIPKFFKRESLLSKKPTELSESVKEKLRGQQIIINIIAPKKLRKKIFWFFVNKLRKENKIIRKCIFNIQPQKAFNGCRVAKQKRKKRKGLRIFN
jgi:hypothetical protein